MMWYITLAVLSGWLLFTVEADSCSGRCGAAVDHTKNCQCNSHCVTFNDCCNDYHSLCTQTTCFGRCDDNVDSSKPCQCNTHCTNYDDCCPDYDHLCSDMSQETQLQRNYFPNNIEDKSQPCAFDPCMLTLRNCLSAICSTAPTDVPGIAKLIWEKDVNRASASQITVNYQGKTTSSSWLDKAEHRFFTYVNENSLFSKATYSRFIHLLDNYDHNDRNTEHLTAHQWQEIDHFLDAVLATDVMVETEKFLRSKGHVTGSSSAFREKLHKVWFELYKRTSSGAVSSSGFEHVFVGETKPTEVSGFHNWIQFYLEEKVFKIDYKGYVTKAEPDLVGAQFSWHGGLWKKKATFFVGTSPEFEMAIYTICFLMQPGQYCNFQLDGHNVSVKTYDNNNWAGQQVATAYPL